LKLAITLIVSWQKDRATTPRKEGNVRVPKRKKEEIIQAYHNGEIKELNNLAYSVPSRFFVLGITPSMVNRVIRSIKKGGG
jgi:hypothetical protein